MKVVAAEGIGCHFELITATLAMAEHAARLHFRFVAAGFSNVFVDQLKRAAQQMQESMNETAACRGHRTAATARMLLEFKQGRDMVRLLETLVLLSRLS